MGWLRLVGSIKLQGSFAEYSLFYRPLLQKRPIILSILLSKATPYLDHQVRGLRLHVMCLGDHVQLPAAGEEERAQCLTSQILVFVVQNRYSHDLTKFCEINCCDMHTCINIQIYTYIHTHTYICINSYC